MRHQNWIFVLIGVLLLIGPLLYRTLILGYNWRNYTGAELSVPDLAVTPIPTLVVSPPAPIAPPSGPIPTRGNVVVDFAHGQPASVSESNLQSLATALSAFGLRFTYWEDRSDWGLEADERTDQLAERLRTASALILFDSWVEWQEDELLVVDNFVRDGGRLLLLSDPDFQGSEIGNISRVANRFGIVFDEGYLYNTEANDENFVHIPLTLVEEAEAGDPLFAYGGHSISGLIQPVAFGAAGVRSSLQAGASYFPVIAQGDGGHARHLVNVLALGDFQMLTEPFVSRHGNRQTLQFVAQFLSGGARAWPLDSFPEYLERSVKLFLDRSLALDAGLIMRIARLQEQLVASGRQVSFAEQLPSFAITDPMTETQEVVLPPADYLYFGMLGADAPADAFVRQMGDSVTFHDGVLSEIQLSSGVRLYADETVLILRRRVRPYGQVLAVLATTPHAIRAGVRRLQIGDFADCFQEPDRLFCPYVGPEISPDTSSTPLSILIINDDDQVKNAAPSDDFTLYLTTLRALGYEPEFVNTSGLGGIDGDFLQGFEWVIWNSNFEGGGPTGLEQNALLEHLRLNGVATTISGGNVGYHMALDQVEPILAISTIPAIPELTGDFPPTLEIAADLPPLASMTLPEDEGPAIILAQSPPSPNAGAPVMLVYQHIWASESSNKPLLLIGMPLSWLPDGYDQALIRNMASWIESMR